jgi:hypothetical protein
MIEISSRFLKKAAQKLLRLRAGGSKTSTAQLPSSSRQYD